MRPAKRAAALWSNDRPRKHASRLGGADRRRHGVISASTARQASSRGRCCVADRKGEGGRVACSRMIRRGFEFVMKQWKWERPLRPPNAPQRAPFRPGRRLPSSAASNSGSLRRLGFRGRSYRVFVARAVRVSRNGSLRGALLDPRVCSAFGPPQLPNSRRILKAARALSLRATPMLPFGSAPPLARSVTRRPLHQG